MLFFDPFLERLWKLKTWKSVSLYNSCFLLWGSLCLSQRYTYSRLNTSDLSQKAFIIYLTRSPEVGSLSVDSVVPQCLLLPTLLPSFTDRNLMTAVAPSISLKWQHQKQKTRKETLYIFRKKPRSQRLRVGFPFTRKGTHAHTLINQRQRKQKYHKHRPTVIQPLINWGYIHWHYPK